MRRGHLKLTACLLLSALTAMGCDGDPGATTGATTTGGGATSNGGTSGGGSTNGGSTNGGSTNGGSTNGGSTNGGSTNGGNTTNGGSTNGGGGSTSGGAGVTPVIVSLTSNATELHYGGFRLQAEITDPQGDATLIGGTLTDPTGTIEYGDFVTTLRGHYQLDLTWEQLNEAASITFNTEEVRSFRAHFFDEDGHSTSGSIDIRLHCDGLSACDGACVDLATDDSHCGGCDHPVGQGRMCVDGKPVCDLSHRDGGDGVCVSLGECSTGYHDSGVGTCVALGTCAPAFHLIGPDCVMTALAISAGGYHTCAIVPDGVRCWGAGLGELPTLVPGIPAGATAVRGRDSDGTSCAIVSGAVKCWGPGRAVEAVSGLSSGVTALSLGTGDHACAVVNGAVRCWGDNGFGQLGDGTTINRATPVQVSGLLSGATDVAVGYGYSCAIVNGGAQCWGTNFSGGLGDGTFQPRPTPAPVIGLTSGVSAIAAGSAACAISNGTVSCWGDNLNHKISDEAGTAVPTPLAVRDHVIAVASRGPYHLCLLLDDGTEDCRGNHVAAADGYTGSSPLVAITTGAQHTCALDAKGTVWCWGDNSAGQLGSPFAPSSASAVSVSGYY